MYKSINSCDRTADTFHVSIIVQLMTQVMMMMMMTT